MLHYYDLMGLLKSLTLPVVSVECWRRQTVVRSATSHLCYYHAKFNISLKQLKKKSARKCHHFFFWAKADNVLIVFSEFNTCKTQRDYYVWVIVHVSGNHTNLTWIRQEFNTKTWQFKFYMFYHPCNIEMISEGSFLAVEDCWEGWWSILACSLVVVETNSWCAPLPHFGQMKVWDEDGRDAVRSFCLLRFSFAALCLSALNSQLALLTDEYQLSRSEASCCHDWWLIPACASCLDLFSWSLQRFLGAPWSRFPSWSSLKTTALGMCTSSILVTWPAKCSCTWSKMNSMLGRLALLRTSSFDTWSSHLMPRMECKQRWWNRSSSLICFR